MLNQIFDWKLTKAHVLGKKTGPSGRQLWRPFWAICHGEKGSGMCLELTGSLWRFQKNTNWSEMGSFVFSKHPNIEERYCKAGTTKRFGFYTINVRGRCSWNTVAENTPYRRAAVGYPTFPKLSSEKASKASLAARHCGFTANSESESPTVFLFFRRAHFYKKMSERRALF